MLGKEITIRREKEEDYRIVENLVREAFWNVYCPGCKEHYILHTLRKNPAFVPELDFVLEQNHKIIGQIVYARSEIVCTNGACIPALTFGPISIAKEYQNQGYGTYLLSHSMKEAQKRGCGVLLITGNIGFYGKSGFVPAKTKGIRYADDLEADYLLAKELIPGFLHGVQGVYKDPECYFASEKNPREFVAFDALFSPKEKKKLPGQIFDS